MIRWFSSVAWISGRRTKSTDASRVDGLLTNQVVNNVHQRRGLADSARAGQGHALGQVAKVVQQLLHHGTAIIGQSPFPTCHPVVPKPPGIVRFEQLSQLRGVHS